MARGKTSLVSLAVAFCSLCAAASRGEYPTTAEAQTLFSPEAMNSESNTLATGVYQDFIQRLNLPAPDDTVRQVEALILNGVMSIGAQVSTNAVVDGQPATPVAERGDLLLECARHFRNFPTNAVSCISLAAYAGNVRPVPFPDNLLKIRGGVHLFCLSTNEADRAAFNEKLQQRAAHIAQRDLQHRVFAANRAVEIYRKRILEVCAVGVAGCRRIMDDQNFQMFTNQLATVSFANEEERFVLFGGLGNCQ